MCNTTALFFTASELVWRNISLSQGYHKLMHLSVFLFSDLDVLSDDMCADVWSF